MTILRLPGPVSKRVLAMVVMLSMRILLMVYISNIYLKQQVTIREKINKINTFYLQLRGSENFKFETAFVPNGMYNLFGMIFFSLKENLLHQSSAHLIDFVIFQSYNYYNTIVISIHLFICACKLFV